jgi:Putative lumazine-binding
VTERSGNGHSDVRDVEAVRATIATYLDWVRTGDAELWPLAFHPRATVVNATRGDDTVAVWPIEDFVRGVADLRARVGVVEETVREIRVDVAHHVASVRLDYSLRLGDESSDGTDFFGLARFGQRWLITHKHYDAERPL